MWGSNKSEIVNRINLLEEGNRWFESNPIWLSNYKGKVAFGQLDAQNKLHGKGLQILYDGTVTLACWRPDRTQ